MSLNERREMWFAQNYNSHAWYRNRYGYPYPYCQQCGMHADEARWNFCLIEVTALDWSEIEGF
jgi:hypothetical protein